MRLRESEAKRVERAKVNPKKDMKTKADYEQEEEDAKFFENAIIAKGNTTFLEMNFSRPIIKVRVFGNNSKKKINIARNEKRKEKNPVTIHF